MIARRENASIAAGHAAFDSTNTVVRLGAKNVVEVMSPGCSLLQQHGACTAGPSVGLQQDIEQHLAFASSIEQICANAAEAHENTASNVRKRLTSLRHMTVRISVELVFIVRLLADESSYQITSTLQPILHNQILREIPDCSKVP